MSDPAALQLAYEATDDGTVSDYIQSAEDNAYRAVKAVADCKASDRGPGFGAKDGRPLPDLDES